MFIPGGAGLARAESGAQNYFGSTRPSASGRFLARNRLRMLKGVGIKPRSQPDWFQ